MIIDTSALMAILLDETEWASFSQAIERDPVRLVCAVSKFEAGMVMASRFGQAGVNQLDALLSTLNIEIIPFDERLADIARDAFIRYGKGRHRAGLNLGDCAAYALAVGEAEPLLFKGADFGATDVEVVPLGQ